MAITLAVVLLAGCASGRPLEPAAADRSGDGAADQGADPAALAAASERGASITRIDLEVAVAAAPSEPEGDALADNIRLFLSLERTSAGLASGTPAAVTRSLLQRQRKLAVAEVEQALMPFGFYSPQLSSTVTVTAGRATVALAVNPGPRTLLRAVRLELAGPGADEPLLQSLLRRAPLRSGAPLDHASYEATKAELKDAAYGLGYLDVAFDRAEILIYPDLLAADLSLVLNSGPRYRFGTVAVQQDVLDPAFVERLVNVEEGAVFDARELIDLQLLLNDTDYFSNVSVQADKEHAVDHAVPVIISTDAERSQAYRVGLGFGTDTGPRTTLGLDWRRLNRRGHQFSTDLRASAIRNTLAAEYRIPIKRVAEDRFKLFARIDQAQIGDADSDQFSLGGIREDSWRGFRRQLYLKYNGERFSFGSAPSRDSRLVIPGLSLSYQRSDDPLFVRRGFSFSVDVHGALADLASDTSFISSSLGLRFVRPLGRRSRLLLRGDLGFLEVEDFAALPPGERFFTGGDRTVRGYSFQSLAPANSENDAIGGTTLSAVSVELDRLLLGGFGVAGFVDHGAAANSFGSDQSTAVGLGLRYRSPVGMIRVDFAHPLDDDDRAVRLHLTLGSDL